MGLIRWSRNSRSLARRGAGGRAELSLVRRRRGDSGRPRAARDSAAGDGTLARRLGARAALRSLCC